MFLYNVTFLKYEKHRVNQSSSQFFDKSEIFLPICEIKSLNLKL